MLRLLNLSIGVILPAILVSMTVLLLGAGAATVFRSDAQARRSERVVVLTEASRSLLGALLATRRERSTVLTAFASGEHRSEADAAILTALGRRVTDGTDLVLTWLRAAEDDVTATAEPLQRAHEALVALRQEVAAALALPKAQRRSATRDAAEARYQALLAALAAANEAVDGAIPREDTTLAGTLAVKRGTWKARTAIGTVATRIQTSLAAGTGWTQAETVSAAEERGRLAAAWAEVAEAAAGTVPDPVRNAFRKAEMANFDGEAATRRKSLTEALSQGQRPELTFQVVRARDIEEQNTIVDLANAALDALVARARMLADEAQATRCQAALFLGVSLLLAGTGLLVTARRILRPIRGMTQAMRALAAGDAAVVIPTQRYRDEVGAMAGAVQVFKDNLIRSRVLEDEAAEARRSAEVQRRAATHEMAERFERAVAGIIAQVTSAAAALQATAQQMADTAQGTARDSNWVAAAAGQAEANVTTVAAAAEELGGSIQEIRRQVNDTSDIAQRAVDEADQTAALVTELHEAAEAIGDVVRLIAALAGQTNLLALNATIEAARAGAAGRGFAVVAAEVKALAGQTAAATDDIAGQIGRIQRVTGDAVSAIGAILSRIREIAGLAGSVAASVEGQGAATQDIVCHVADATAGTRAVTVTITTVAQAAAQTGAAAAHVLAAASDLSHHADALKTETDGFLVTVRAA